MTRHLFSLISLLAVLLAFSSTSTAGINFARISSTLIALEDNANPAGRLAISPEGDVAVVTNTPQQTLIYQVDTNTETSSLSTYSYQERALQPTSWTFGPENDLLLRGNVQLSPSETVGVTTRIQSDGTLVWEQPDSAFNDDPEYVGRYVQATGPIAYSPDAQRLLIFSQSSFNGDIPVSQGTMLVEFNGDVRVPSITFGDQLIGATLNAAITRPDGLFFIYYFAQNDVGARFFLYNGRESINRWEAEGGDWSKRLVRHLDFDENDNLILLWSDLENTDVAHLTKLDPDGKLLWTEELSGVIPVKDDTGQTVDGTLNPPSFMVVGTDEIVLLRNAGPAFVFDVRSSDDGSPLGFSDFSELTEDLVFDLKFIPNSNSEYAFTAVDPDDTSAVQVIRVQLETNNDPVVIGTGDNNGTNNNGTSGTNNGTTPLNTSGSNDATIDDDVPDTVCGCVFIPHTPSSPIPALPLPLALLSIGALLTIRRNT